MRFFIAAAIIGTALAAQSAHAQTPQEKQAGKDTPPHVQADVQLPPSVTRALSDTAAALKNKEVKLPDDVAKSLDKIAAALDPPKPDASTKPFWYFVEHWSWLFGFFFVAAAAFYLGVRDSIKAVKRETDAEEARSAQRLIEANDSTGPGKLKEVREKYPIDPKARKLVRNKWWLALTLLFFAFGLVGIAGLLTLAFVPENEVWGEYHFQHAKSSAWDILDTNFSAAFAATWIALLFYGASQNHRLREANEHLRIATDEAESIAAFRADRQRSAAFEKYTELHAAVAGQKFPVLGLDSAASDEKTIKRHVEGFRRIEAVAIARALNDVEIIETDETKKINDEIRRLKPFGPPLPHMRWIVAWNFAVFLERLFEAKLLPTNKDDWERFYTAISTTPPDDDNIREATKLLADKLPKVIAS